MAEDKYSQRVQDALSDYAQGKITARQTQKILKGSGYKADLREGRKTGDIQVFKIDGSGHGLFYEFSNGGDVSKGKTIDGLTRRQILTIGTTKGVQSLTDAQFDEYQSMRDNQRKGIKNFRGGGAVMAGRGGKFKGVS